MWIVYCPRRLPWGVQAITIPQQKINILFHGRKQNNLFALFQLELLILEKYHVSLFFDKTLKFKIVFFMIPMHCISCTSSINCLKKNCISKISIVSPQQINCISKSTLYLLSVNIVFPGNYLEFIPSPLKISICEWAVFDNKLDMNYNHQAKFGITNTKM